MREPPRPCRRPAPSRRGGEQLQREPLLQLLRPRPRPRRVGAYGQPPQRGLRRDDGAPSAFRRPGRLHVQAAEIEGHTAHDAGGLRFEVVEPLVEHRVTYDGRVLLLDDPAQMVDPRQAFADNALVGVLDRPDPSCRRPGVGWRARMGGRRCAVELDPERSFARGHPSSTWPSPGRCPSATTSSSSPMDSACATTLGPALLAEHLVVPVVTANLGPDLGFAVTVSGTEDGGDHAPRLPVRPRPLRRRPLGHGARRRAADRLRRRRPPCRPRHARHRRPPLRGRGPRVVAHPAAQPPHHPHRRQRQTRSARA